MISPEKCSSAICGGSKDIMFSFDDAYASVGRPWHIYLSSSTPKTTTYNYGVNRWGYAPWDFDILIDGVYQRPAL